MSFILLGILNSQVSAVAQAYWVNYAFDPSSLGDANSYGINKDLVVNGQTKISTNEAGVITRFNADGTTNWRRTVANTTGDLRVFGTRGIVGNGTNFFAMYQDEQSGNSDLVLLKLDNTPSIVAQRNFGGAANFKVQNSNIANDSSFNIVAGGYYEAANNETIFGVWNSSLTFQFQRRIQPSAGSFFNPRFAFDSSGNIIVSPQWNNSPTRLQVVKYDSSGTAQWQRSLTGTSALTQPTVTTDTSGNVYVAYRDQHTSGWGAGLAKWNSSGTLQFQKTLSRTGWDYNDPGNILQGTDGNIYAAHTLNDGGTGRIFLVSYDTSGNVNWQRYIDLSAGSSDVYVYGLDMNAAGDLVLAGFTYDTISGFKRYAVSMVLPSNGNFIGTYTDGFMTFTGEAGSHSLSNTSYTGATSSHTLNTPSLTEGASSVSLATRTFTEAKVNIG